MTDTQPATRPGRRQRDIETERAREKQRGNDPRQRGARQRDKGREKRARAITLDSCYWRVAGGGGTRCGDKRHAAQLHPCLKQTKDPTFRDRRSLLKERCDPRRLAKSSMASLLCLSAQYLLA